MHLVWNTNWDDDVVMKLGDPIEQLINDCWAVGPVRQYEIRLKLRGLLPNHQALSIQEIINITPRRFLNMMPGRGEIHDIWEVGEILKTQGTVLEEFCPFTQNLHTNPRRAVLGDRFIPTGVEVRSREFVDDFYTSLVSELVGGPVAVRIPVYSSYFDLAYEDFVYNPTYGEIVNDGYSRDGHVLLATANGQLDGLNVLHCQDSQGLNWGHGGFITVAAHLVSDFFSIGVE
uniref:Peptidase C1A papain C-terminal domain-containing protein n=1 Tax=Noccaea caerulescens TaxID=107243 RepID=A0A1J3H6X2_NOCCA